MESAYVCARDLVESGDILYRDLYARVANEQLHAFSPDGLPAIIWKCAKHDGDFPDSLNVFDDFGRFDPEARGANEYIKMEKLRLLVSKMWGIEVHPKRIITAYLPKSFKSKCFSGKNREADIQELLNKIDNFLLPMDPEGRDNIGLTADEHKRIFLSLKFLRNDVENILKDPEPDFEEARVQATNLKIIEGLLRYIKIEPASKGAAKQVREILLESNISLDEKTIRERIKKINENPAANSSTL